MDSATALSGNRCGHDPKNPRFPDPKNNPRTARHGLSPKIIEAVIKKSRNYYNNPELLPSLNAANGSDRQMRSERREGCNDILEPILRYMDIRTLRVGIPQIDGTMVGLPMESKTLEDGTRIVGLVEMAGLGLRRAERAAHDLKTAGILGVNSICNKIEEGVYQGISAIRTISAQFFTALGMELYLKHEQRKAKERWEKKTNKAERKNLANVKMAMNNLKGKPQTPTAKEADEAVAATGGPKPAMELAFKAMRKTLGMPPNPNDTS
jgi:hypothetical protein